MMDWAAIHARSRGAPWWKSFTTGKTALTLGGIPHVSSLFTMIRLHDSSLFVMYNDT